MSSKKRRSITAKGLAYVFEDLYDKGYEAFWISAIRSCATGYTGEHAPALEGSDSDIDLAEYGDCDHASIYEEGGRVAAMSQEHYGADGVKGEDGVSAGEIEKKDVKMKEESKQDGSHDRVVNNYRPVCSITSCGIELH